MLDAHTEAERTLIAAYWRMAQKSEVDLVALAAVADDLGVPLDRANELISAATSEVAQGFFDRILADGRVTPEESASLADLARRLGGPIEQDGRGKSQLLLAMAQWDVENPGKRFNPKPTDMIRQPGGGYRLRSEIEEELAGWEEWRAELAPSGIGRIEGEVLELTHESSAEPLSIVVAAVLFGRAVYLDGWCPKLNERRTLHLDRIGKVQTADGQVYANAREWLFERADLPENVARALGKGRRTSQNDSSSSGR